MRKDTPNSERNITEQELLDLLQQFQGNTDSKTDPAVSPADDLFGEDLDAALPDTPDTQDTSFEDIPLIFEFDQTERPRKAEKVIPQTVASPPEPLLNEEETEKEKPKKQPKKKNAFIAFIFPCKGDPIREIIRKSVMILSVLALLISMGCLAYFMILEPQQVTLKNEHFESLYTDKEGNEDAKNPYDYPAGMLSSFRQLYDVNKDIAGWLSYVSTDAETFMDINLPVVHCDNNDKYLSTAFDGTYSRSGTLFFESSSTFSQDTENKINIIYGHNMASGQMFAPLNLLYDSVYRARSATSITLNTLYHTYHYKVFAVIVCDENAAEDKRFGYLRNSFADSADFVNYVNELRARSLYDYPVDVNADDQLLILSTCTNPSQVIVENGRLAVIARRVRADEEPSIDTLHISQNTDVIMPYAWYTLQKKKPHAFYTDPNYHIPEDSVETKTTQAVTSTTTATTLPSKGTRPTDTTGTTIPLISVVTTRSESQVIQNTSKITGKTTTSTKSKTSVTVGSTTTATTTATTTDTTATTTTTTADTEN